MGTSFASCMLGDYHAAIHWRRPAGGRAGEVGKAADALAFLRAFEVESSVQPACDAEVHWRMAGAEIAGAGGRAANGSAARADCNRSQGARLVSQSASSAGVLGGCLRRRRLA